MSLEEWQHGLHTGLEQNFLPALERRNKSWHRACQKIIDHCVAPNMRPLAMKMLHEAMIAAQRDSANDEDTIPPS